jgi:hypothetical protein
MGLGTYATGGFSIALGSFSQSTGPNSLSQGTYARSIGTNSTAIGNYTTANNTNSFVSGNYTTSDADNQFVIGRYNSPITDPNTQFIIGNGADGALGNSVVFETSAVTFNTKVTINGSLLLPTPLSPPNTSTDTGTAGTITWDSDFIYVCVATDQWKRVGLSGW